LIPIWMRLFNLIRIRIWLFDTDPDPCHFKEGNVSKTVPTFCTSILDFPCQYVGPTGPNQKAYFGKFSLPFNFVVLIKVANRSGSYIPGYVSRIQILENNMDTCGSATLPLLSMYHECLSSFLFRISSIFLFTFSPFSFYSS
jgi:hypothetical protein